MNSLGNHIHLEGGVGRGLPEYLTKQRCIQSDSLRPGTQLFFCWMQRILNKGSKWTQKKNRMFMQIENARKKKQHHTIRKYGERQFLSADWLFTVTFQIKAKKPLSFLNTFLSRLRSAMYEFPSVVWCYLGCFLGETISNTFDLPLKISHFCWSWDCCMLSKWISSIHLFIVSKMTENPTSKYIKFWFHAALLINSGRASVFVLVAHNLVVLQIMQLFRN